MILAFCVNSRWNRQFLRSFWSREQKCRKLAGTSRRRVNENGSQQAENVSTPQREFYLTIIKSKRDHKSRGIEERTDESTKIRAAATQISGEEIYFCIIFFFDKTEDDL